MKFGSVCSGIEAASVAWHPLGWNASFLSEIEPFPRSVLTHHYPDVPLHGDFTTIKKGQYDAIDVLVGGTPCQSFSVAGLRKGLDDPRGNLMLGYLALADKYRPDWLVWENVPGVLSSNGGRDFGTFLGGLGQLGYGFAYRVLDAQYFGLAQQRPRVFVVAHAGGSWQRAAAVLFERESLLGNLAAGGTQRARSKRVLPCFTRRGPGSLREEEAYVIDGQRIRHLTPEEMERGIGFPVGYTDLSKESPFARRKTSLESGNEVRHDAGTVRRDACETERSLCLVRGIDGTSGGGPLPSDRQSSRDSLPSVQHQTASSGGHGLGNAGMGVSGRRRVADGPRYKALGNSMAVPCMEWLGQRIQAVSGVERLEIAA